MKRIIATSLVSFLLFSALPVSAELETEADDIVIYDSTPELFVLPEIDEVPLFEENESEMETVIISTADDLIKFRDNVNSDIDYSKNKIFKLANNIDLGGIEWEPIGYNDAYSFGDDLNMLRDCSFRGIFDGQGNTISNFKLTDSDYTYMGFFGTVHLGTVRNLNIVDASINYTGTTATQIPEFTGLLCAFSNYATITDCSVNGSISIVNNSAFAQNTTVCAGMISGVGLAKLDNCNAYGSISVNTLTPPYVGGIFGFASTATAEFDAYINNSTSEVDIDIDSISGISAGGIIGRGSDSISEISNCAYALDSEATITAHHTYRAENLSNASVFMGGIAGVNNSNIKNCNVGDITITANAESSATIGGIAGKNEATVDSCTTLADISVDINRSSLKAASSSSIGGVVGGNGATHNTTSDPAPADIIPTIINCNITPDVSIKAESDSGTSTVCGFIAGLAFAPSEIINCTSTASDMEVNSTNAGTYAGGICGLLNGAAAKYCHSSGSLGEKIKSATSTYIGGIAGDANLKYYYTKDTDFGIDSSLFIKTVFYGASIEDCSSDMDITALNSTRIYAGGIVGYLTNNYTENNTTYYIKANRELSVARCSAKGDITVTPDAGAFGGGAVGYSVDGKIYDSYATGNVTSTKDASSSYLGGFVGVIFQNRHNYEQIVATADNCYSTGKVTVPENASKLSYGDFIACTVISPTTKLAPKLTNCYFLESNKQTTISGLTPLSAEELTADNSFTAWDFNDIWKMSELGPILRYEETSFYSHTAENGNIVSLIISKPHNNSKLFAVTYNNEKIIDIKEYDITDENYVNTNFLILPCEIVISDNTRLYLWGGKDFIEPLTDSCITSNL